MRPKECVSKIYERESMGFSICKTGHHTIELGITTTIGNDEGLAMLVDEGVETGAGAGGVTMIVTGGGVSVIVTWKMP